MTVVANKRSVMSLFSRPACPDCHRVRIVLAEKGIAYEAVLVEDGEIPEDLLDLNPYHSVPTLVDRELALYEARVIMEYLDERFPHPPLMPVDPVARARFRLAMYRIERDWYTLVAELDQQRTGKAAAAARKTLRERVLSSSEVFAAYPYFLSEEYSIVDSTILPILWRLPAYGVELPDQAAPIMEYAERMFAREPFQRSLTEAERDMRGGR